MHLSGSGLAWRPGTMHVWCHGPAENEEDGQLTSSSEDRTWSSDALAAKDTAEAGLRVSEAELVTMIGWSGPNFTDEAMSWTACVTLGETMWLQK